MHCAGRAADLGYLGVQPAHDRPHADRRAVVEEHLRDRSPSPTTPASRRGWASTTTCKFLALISISLGVLNLLPIPILDGGHLLYYLVEVIKGGPLSERVMEIGQQIGLGLLVLLMAFAFYNDINRLISG